MKIRLNCSWWSEGKTYYPGDVVVVNDTDYAFFKRIQVEIHAFLYEDVDDSEKALNEGEQAGGGKGKRGKQQPEPEDNGKPEDSQPEPQPDNGDGQPETNPDDGDI